MQKQSALKKPQSGDALGEFLMVTFTITFLIYLTGVGEVVGVGACGGLTFLGWSRRIKQSRLNGVDEGLTIPFLRLAVCGLSAWILGRFFTLEDTGLALAVNAVYFLVLFYRNRLGEYLIMLWPAAPILLYMALSGNTLPAPCKVIWLVQMTYHTLCAGSSLLWRKIKKKESQGGQVENLVEWSLLIGWIITLILLIF